MFFSNKNIIGLDIGTSTIKACELSVSRGSASLDTFAVVPTPHGSISGGEIVDPSIVAQSISSVIEQLGTKRKYIATGIWGTAVITKKLSIPKMDTSLMEEQIKWEAEQYIPFDINEINLDYHVFKRPSANPEMMEVMLVAAKRDFIFRYVEAIELAGKTCSILDLSSFGFANCFFYNYPHHAGVVGLLNIGAGITSFVVVEQGEILFSRDLPVGGHNYTSDVSQRLGVSFEEGENLKISASTGQASPSEVLETINSTHEVVVDEIKRAFDFYTATSTESPVQKVYVSGGGSSTPALVNKLSNGLGLPIEYLNPFNQLGFNSKNFGHEYLSQVAPFISIATGLALRKVGDK